MRSNAKTVKEYLDGLPPDRRKAVSEVRKVIKKHLPKGFKEAMQYGMIGYVVPLSKYPEGYLNDPEVPLPYAALASQKNHISVYLMSVYGDKKLYEWFLKEWGKTGKKINMGKACVRFRKLEDIPLELIGKVIGKVSVDEHIKKYEAARSKKK